MLARRFICRALAALTALALGAWPAAAAPKPGAAADTDAIGRLVGNLDSRSFSTREAAVRDLRGLVSERDTGSDDAVTRLFRLSLDPKVSFEAQQSLEAILAGVELPAALHSEAISDKEMAELIGHLAGDRFTVRETATRRLAWVLRNPANIAPAMHLLKARLADSTVPVAVRQELTRHYDTVRRAWLLAPAKDCPLPGVTAKQIADLIDTVSASADNPSAVANQQIAIRELQDLLCREEYREALAADLRNALEAATDPAAAARLGELTDLAKPSMVAEIWTSVRYVNLGGGFIISDTDAQQVRLATMQYLHIGVPQVPENAPRATFFDRCDDKTAHCVSGNTLHPGDYPVGTAILHPDGEMTLFHLINLPTPRRRLIYEYSASDSETVRLRKLSQNTCDAYLSKERPLTNSDLSVLMLLDQSVVAEFAGRFFRSIDDAPLEDARRSLTVGPVSLHGGICYALAVTGRKEAAPAIIRALEKERFLPLDGGRRYDLPRLALLSIARRDPWENVNDWLGGQLSKQVSLVATVEPAPDLAASAAAILLERHDKSPDDFGLETIADNFCQQIRMPVFRFRNDAARQAVLRWWVGTQEVARAGRSQN